MKLVSLNTWGGKIYEPLMKFIGQNAKDTDIFCFQEVFNTTSGIKEMADFRMNLFDEITNVLKNYFGYFTHTVDNYIAGSFRPDLTDFNLSWGLAIFVKDNLNIKTRHDFWVYGDKNSFNQKDLNSLPRNVQNITIIFEGKQFTIGNIHGIWVKGSKEDTPSRLKQSKYIVDYMDKQDGKKILVGDFNLNINTKSLTILEKKMINLIKKYNIQTTRNKHFPGSEKFADYTFVSPDVKIRSFQVPHTEVSDHLPMILQFS